MPIAVIVVVSVSFGGSVTVAAAHGGCGGLRCRRRSVSFGQPLRPPGFHECREPFGGIRPRSAEDAETDIDEQAEEEDSDEYNGDLGGVS